MIHPYDPQAAMNAKYAAFARKDADTARRLQSDPAGRSELVSLAARLLHLRTFLDDDPHDEELRRVAARLRKLANGAAPRASQAAGEPHSTGCGSRAASDPGGGSAGHTELRCGRAAVEGSCPDHPDASAERCESRHPERGLLCTLPAGHDTHRHVGHAWTTLDRLDGHVLVDTGDLAEVILVASGLVMPGTARGAVDRLNAVLAEAVKGADQ